VLAAFCDGCLAEIVSNDKKEMIDWVAAHYDHQRSFEVAFVPTVSVDPILGVRENGILRRA
jgi:hypothetical protein